MSYYLMIGGMYSVTWVVLNVAHVNQAMSLAEDEMDVSHLTEKQKTKMNTLLTLVLFITITALWPVRLYHDLKE